MAQRSTCRTNNAVLHALTVLLLRLREHITAITITDISSLKVMGGATPIVSTASLGFLEKPNEDGLRRFHSTIVEDMAVNGLCVEELRLGQVYLGIEPNHLEVIGMFAEVLEHVKVSIIEICVEQDAAMDNLLAFIRLLATAPVLCRLDLHVASIRHYLDVSLSWKIAV
ncbi:hypothetical protein DOTSEDRAFT_29115 [Dothistroma septosporum NZE10]|uniref:Uncharacterized protein n=1 Tax=Dothistroma septosporum (strain NZE10 / CBS 128990) TaxID=675120 RepID=M2WIX4_DOTSN|nr:hypothetical protein DOTSEDRAFT_29115 [Dothistroma septosporum NZE10]